MQDVPQKDIAKKLGISANAVSQRIKTLLKEYLIMLVMLLNSVKQSRQVDAKMRGIF